MALSLYPNSPLFSLYREVKKVLARVCLLRRSCSAKVGLLKMLMLVLCSLHFGIHTMHGE